MQPHRNNNELDVVWHTVNTYCGQIETMVKNFVRTMQQNSQLSGEPNDLNARNSSILNSVPSPSSNQITTLHFTPETKQIFLRTALTKEFFQLLKKISKRYLANVPEDQRKQATKVAQAIAKAVTDYRFDCITEKDIATYKTHIQQSFGREYNIPNEQIRIALQQKIRVFLQNTKADHPKWIEKYAGCMNVTDNTIHVNPNVKLEDSNDDDDDSDNTITSTDLDTSYTEFPPLRDSDDSQVLNSVSLPFKRPIDEIHPDDNELPSHKRQKIQSYTEFSQSNMFPNELDHTTQRKL